MKSKAPLVLMEQVVMVLVFALTAAFCLRMFVLADRLSVKYEATDRAVIEAQNAAEWLKQGKTEEYLTVYDAVKTADAATVYFNQDWEVTTEEKAEFYLRIFESENGTDVVWKKEIVVCAGEEELFRITVAGQKTEVDEDA